MTTNLFGSSVKRREAPKLITGQGTYTDDIKLFGMLHAAIVRSPHAHARIRSVDVSRARNLPGVVGVFTGADLQSEAGPLIVGWLLPGITHTSRPAMAFDTARFAGEPVAVVVANDSATAVDAAGMVDVDYEPLSAVVNAEETTRSGAPQLQYIRPLHRNPALHSHGPGAPPPDRGAGWRGQDGGGQRTGPSAGN